MENNIEELREYLGKLDKDLVAKEKAYELLTKDQVVIVTKEARDEIAGMLGDLDKFMERAVGLGLKLSETDRRLNEVEEEAYLKKLTKEDDEELQKMAAEKARMREEKLQTLKKKRESLLAVAPGNNSGMNNVTEDSVSLTAKGKSVPENDLRKCSTRKITQDKIKRPSSASARASSSSSSISAAQAASSSSPSSLTISLKRKTLSDNAEEIVEAKRAKRESSSNESDDNDDAADDAPPENNNNSSSNNSKTTSLSTLQNPGQETSKSLVRFPPASQPHLVLEIPTVDDRSAVASPASSSSSEEEVPPSNNSKDAEDDDDEEDEESRDNSNDFSEDEDADKKKKKKKEAAPALPKKKMTAEEKEAARARRALRAQDLATPLVEMDKIPRKVINVQLYNKYSVLGYKDKSGNGRYDSYVRHLYTVGVRDPRVIEEYKRVYYETKKKADAKKAEVAATGGKKEEKKVPGPTPRREQTRKPKK